METPLAVTPVERKSLGWEYVVDPTPVRNVNLRDGTRSRENI